jgi:hypothetical protein
MRIDGSCTELRVTGMRARQRRRGYGGTGRMGWLSRHSRWRTSAEDAADAERPT